MTITQYLISDRGQIPIPEGATGVPIETVWLEKDIFPKLKGATVYQINGHSVVVPKEFAK
jgi:hypothetical protein